MKRRLNYTGRKKITRDKLSIVLQRKNGAIASFSAKLDLSDLSVPSDARVYVEAYHSTDLKRYDFGTFAKIETPRDTSLAGIAHTENLKFRVLIVDETGQYGLILAHADRIRPLADSKRKSILPVEFRDLAQQTWKIDFSTELEGGPLLLLNSRIPNIAALAKSDPLFFFLVYPAVIREVLIHMIFVDRVDSCEDPSTEWHRDWLEFSRGVLSGAGSPSILDPSSEDFDGDATSNWTDTVVEEFCSSRKGWPQFVTKLTGGETA